MKRLACILASLGIFACLPFALSQIAFRNPLSAQGIPYQARNILGHLTALYTPESIYPLGNAGPPVPYTGSAAMIQTLGTRDIPDTTQNPGVIFQKISASTATTGNNYGMYVHGVREAGSNVNNFLTSFAADAVDNVGTGYVEAVRGASNLIVGGALNSAYGGSFFANSNTATNINYLIGIEAEVENLVSDAPAVPDFKHLSASYNATCGLGVTAKRCTTAFLANPFNSAQFQHGIIFAYNCCHTDLLWSSAAVVNGLDLSNGSYTGAAILLGSDHRISANDTSGTPREVFGLYTTDNMEHFCNQGAIGCVIGNESINVTLGGPLVMAKGYIKPAQTTVSSLPACNSRNRGDIYTVTDAVSPSYNGILRGGGAVVVLALCSGANWTAH